MQIHIVNPVVHCSRINTWLSNIHICFYNNFNLLVSNWADCIPFFLLDNKIRLTNDQSAFILICITRVCPYSEKIQLKVIKCVFSFFLSFSANRTIFSLTNQFSDDFCPSKAQPLNSSMKEFRLNLVIFLTHWPAQHNFDTGRYL